MDWLVLDGVKPYDGRYQFDIFGEGVELSTREWGWIKRFSGYMPLTMEDGFAGADPELFAVFAVIALRRAGRIEAREVSDVFERLADAPFGSTVRLESDPGAAGKEEEDAGPPAGSSSLSSSSAGAASTTSSETSPSPRNGSGIPASDFSGLLPARSES